MAASTKTSPSGVRLQSWLPSDLAAQVKARADDERRSVSSTIRLALEDRLAKKGRR